MRRDTGLTWVSRRCWFHVVAGSTMSWNCCVCSGGRMEGKLGCCWAETSLVCDGRDRSWFNGYGGGETIDLDGCLSFWLMEGERMGL